MREWLQRLRDRLRRDTLDRELAEEIAFHKAQLARDAVHAGASAIDATAAANRRFGNETATREAARERWSFPWLEHLLSDLRYALRGLRRSPGFTATVIITLGLGIGANATMFGVVDQLMFRPLAYLRDPASVHRIYWQWHQRERLVTSMSGPYTRYVDLQRETTSFAQLAAFSERYLAVGEGDALRERRVGAVSASYFAFFDARPVLGRFFGDDEDRTPRGADVAVLSHAFWRTEYGGRDVLGTLIQVGNVRAQIIGVAPPGFHGVNDADPPAVWIPITTFAGSGGTEDAKTYFTHYRWGWMHIIARLKDGVTLDRATGDATQAFRRSWDAALSDGPGVAPSAVALPTVAISAVRPGAGPDPALEARTAIWVLVVAAIVLVIAAANVTNLFIARALRRQREVAVRLALGASTARLMSQSVVESVVLATLSGVSALLIARWGQAAIATMLTTSTAATVVPRELGDWRSMAVTLVLSLVVGAVVGVVPALLLQRGDLTRALRGGSRGGHAEGRRLRATLLVVQGALSTVLLVGAFLFVRSLDRVRALPMGYDAEQVLLLNRIVRGPFPGSPALRAMTSQLLSAAQAMPQVEAAAWVSSAPFVSTSNTTLFVDGIDSTARLGTFTNQVTTPDYFRVMGTRIVRGRGLTDDDRFGMPDVAVVSESMARVLWPGRDALGACFRQRADTMPCVTVVGIAEDMVQGDITGTQRYHYYLSLSQVTRTDGNGMIVKVRGDAVAQAEAIRRTLQRELGGNAYLTVQPMRTIVANAQRSWRLGATMFAAFGLLAVLVAAVGLYGVIGYDVAQRMHELGVRVALGAQRRDILRLVMGQGVRLVLTGVALGLAVSLYAGRWLQPLLFEQRAVDPVAYASVGLLMLLVALLASARPAARAAAADPAAAMRTD